jgi:hypothetical protein
MTLDPKDLAAATAALATELAAVDSCGPDWSPADQARYVRVLLEDGLDELARNDDAHYDYVADCVLLAGQNMQDARLQLIEERLDAVESPPTTVAKLVIDTAIMLGFELAFVIGAEVAVPGLIVLAAARLRARTTRQLATGPAAVVADSKFVGRLIADVADRRANVDVMRELARQSPGGVTQLGEHTALAELATARHKLRAGLAAAATSELALTRVEKALAAPAAPEAPDLAAFLAGVVQDTTVSRVAENGATAVTALLKTAALPPAPTGGPRSRVFLTSLVAGGILSQVRQEQETAAREWRQLRFGVRALPDASLLRSPLAHELCLRIRLFTVDPVVEGGLVDSREALVLGMETQLWLAWLRHVDALGVVMTGDFPAVRQRGPELEPGMVFEDKHVQEAKVSFIGPGVVTYSCRGALYPGIRRLTDGLAEFLYLRYAHPYFLAHPDDAPSPLVFDAVRYEEVPGMPVQVPLGLTDIDRADRIGEMKLLVITTTTRSSTCRPPRRWRPAGPPTRCRRWRTSPGRSPARRRSRWRTWPPASGSSGCR